MQIENNMSNLIVVGDGLAALEFCQNYRSAGGEKSIIFITEESQLPCGPSDRSQLLPSSREGHQQEATTLPRELDVECILNTSVVEIDRTLRVITTSSGVTIGYDELVLDAGPEVALSGIAGGQDKRVVSYRCEEDIKRTISKTKIGDKIAVLGGGIPGLDDAEPGSDERAKNLEILCRCQNITTSSVQNLIRENPALDQQTIKKMARVGSGCGRCAGDFEKVYLEMKAQGIKPQRGIVATRLVRSFHLFSSLMAAVFLLFFAATGYMMNHADDFGVDDVEQQEITGVMPKSILSEGSDAEWEAWHRQMGARGDVVAMEREDDVSFIEFKSAGLSYEGEVDHETGVARIFLAKASFLGGLVEMHKSRPTKEGESSLFIDLMALLMVIVSLSGVFLFIRMMNRIGWLAIATFLLGLAVSIVTYFQLL